MTRRRLPPTLFVSETARIHTWTANQQFDDCVRLQFGDSQDVSVFYRNPCCCQQFIICSNTCITFISTGAAHQINPSAANTAPDVLVLTRDTTGVPANCIGGAVTWGIETSTTINTRAARIEARWTNVTHACRRSDLIFLVEDDADNVLEEYLRLDGSAQAVTMPAQIFLLIGVFTDANRGCPGTAGRVIFNTDDGNLNIDNGTNWITPHGCTT